MVFRKGMSFNGGVPKKGQSAAASYTDFYEKNSPSTKPAVTRTGSGTKPAYKPANTNKFVPKKGRTDDTTLEEKAKAIQRRLRQHNRIKNAGSKVTAAMKRKK